MEAILEILSSDEFEAWYHAITAVIASASAITMLTPTTTDDKIYNGVMKVLNFLSLNVFKNKNADDV